MRDGVAVVCPPSEIDLHNANRLRVICQDAIEASGPRVVVDLSGTTFIDTTALGVFVGVWKQVKANGGWLRLVTGDSSTVQKILILTGLDAILGSYPAVEDAMTPGSAPEPTGQPVLDRTERRLEAG
jgi:anti-sigma B factor antagonist